MKNVFFYLATVFLFASGSLIQAQEIEKQIVIKDRKNSDLQQEQPYVILISADGFRYDYIEQFNANFLKEMGDKHVRAEALIPSFPSVTFPNHYSIVTGLYPSHHGLVGNNMLDVKTGDRYSLRNHKAIINPKWYGGTPIWVLAEQNHMLTACYYWPGSEAPIKGVFPTYYYKYSDKTPVDDRIKEVVNWLNLPEEVRPHLITFYMPDIDHAGHKYGPDAPETERAVQFVDESMRKLTEAVNQTGLKVYYVFTSDHGMNAVDKDKPLSFPIQVDPNDLDLVSNGTYVSVFVKDKKKIKKYYKKIKKNASKDEMEVYLKKDTPSHLHFGAKDDRFNRIGDIVLFAKAPYLFSNSKPIPGAHGYDPKEVENMNAVFLMWGPEVNPKKIGRVENVHIYPLLAKILGLQIQEKIDGDNRLVKELL